MHTIRLTQHEAAILTWLLATPLGKKARGFAVVRTSRTTRLEVIDAFDLVDLVSALQVADLFIVGWKEPSILSLQHKAHDADMSLK